MLAARLKDTERLRAARSRLVEAGCADDTMQKLPPLRAIFEYLPNWYRRTRLVGSFPPLQVILLDEKRACEARWDEDLKVLNLAPWHIDTLKSNDMSACCEDELFAEYLPRVVEARRLQARLQQRIGLLRHVEALRLYAAEHEGKLPEKLSDCSVPLPEDPFTGKPFRYRKDEATAHLYGTPPRGEENVAAYNLHYEVTIQKAAR
jgi:hypothetical protein